MLLAASGNAQTVVSGNLLTSNKQTTDWQICDTTDNSGDSVDNFDPSHLQTAACAYRETPAVAGTCLLYTSDAADAPYV